MMPVSIGDRVAEHRAVVRERMEFAALAAGVDAGRQVREQRRVELAAGKAPIQDFAD